MKRTVRVLRRARRDLQEIYDFTLREVPVRAGGLLDGLLAAVESLATMGDRVARPRDQILRASGYRFLVHEGYLIFYKVVGRQVRVHRVLHGRRAYRDVL